MKKNIDYSIYLVTDRDLMSAETLEEAVEQAILGGCTLVQLREKEMDSRSFFEEAKRIKEICDLYGVGMIINDRIDIALAVSADGVHIGQSDIPAKEVRKIIGKEMILGVSATNLKEALEAEADGADYLGVGAMFQTNTKTDAKVVTKNELIEIKQNTHIPVVIIGGINEHTLPVFDDCEIDGVAVVSAILSKKDIRSGAQQIETLFYKNRRTVISDKKLVLFDLDGTLLDSLGVWQKIDLDFFKERNLSMPSDFLNITMPMSFMETAKYVIEEFNLKDSPEELIHDWNERIIKEYRDNIQLKVFAQKYLEELKNAQLELAIVSSLTKELYEPVLKRLQLRSYFTHIFSADDVGYGKGSTKLYRHALQICGVEAKEVVLFEDIPEAAESGKKVGFYVIGVKDSYNKKTIRRLVDIADETIVNFYAAPIIRK